jgi:hypothetical protein
MRRQTLHGNTAAPPLVDGEATPGNDAEVIQVM